MQYYRKVPKFSDARKLCCNLPKIQTKRPNLGIFHQKVANGIANSEDPDQTAPLGAVLSLSAVFVQTCLSENLESLRYSGKYEKLLRIDLRLIRNEEKRNNVHFINCLLMK